MSEDLGRLRADNKRLRQALEMAIRSHENLIDLAIIPASFFREARKITDDLRAALNPWDVE